MPLQDISLHPYYGRTVALATMHRKEQVIRKPLSSLMGLHVVVPEKINTDMLGTFSGEVERHGTPREVALRKARLGMQAAGLPLGLASEGSFGPHRDLPFVPENHELLVFIDDELGIQVVEQILTTKTNFAHHTAKDLGDLGEFLSQADFPSHGLIVRPNIGSQSGLLYKGLTSLEALKDAVEQCASASTDGYARVETDMRAHMNPMRRKVIRQAAIRLARRLACLCPECGTPGLGRVDVIRGLPCETCGGETELVSGDVHGCAKCTFRQILPRGDGLRFAPAQYCPLCNP